MIASYAPSQMSGFTTELVLPITDFGINTGWGMPYGTCMSYVDNNRYFEKHFNDGTRTGMIWHRYWSASYPILSDLPQLSFGGGSGFVEANSGAFLYHAEGSIQGYDINIHDCAMCPYYPNRAMDYRSWHGSYGTWYNDGLRSKYNTGQDGKYPLTKFMCTNQFSGSWLQCGSPSLGQYPKTVTAYPWALMLFMDITDGDINRYFNSSATGISIWSSSAKFGFKFYIEPIADSDTATDKWSWWNVDRPSLTSGGLADWSYKGRPGVARIVARSTTDGQTGVHDFTMVKVSSPASGYSLMSITNQNQSIARISEPCFNMGYINQTIDVFGNVHTTPRLTGIYILESGCEYEITYF